jgi:hypothetical protein
LYRTNPHPKRTINERWNIQFVTNTFEKTSLGRLIVSLNSLNKSMKFEKMMVSIKRQEIQILFSLKIRINRKYAQTIRATAFKILNN